MQDEEGVPEREPLDLPPMELDAVSDEQAQAWLDGLPPVKPPRTGTRSRPCSGRP